MSAELPEWTLHHRSVDELELTVRTYNCLKYSEIRTIGELAGKTERELLKIKALGKKGVGEIRRILEDLGIDLKQEDVYSLPSYHAKPECPFCERKINGERPPESDVRLIVDDGGPFYGAWKVHHKCLVRMWAENRRMRDKGDE